MIGYIELVTYAIQTSIGPLQDLVTWYGINYTGTQITQWDFQNKGTLTRPARLSFVLKVPLHYLRPSVIYSVPCDRIMQRAYYMSFNSFLLNVAFGSFYNLKKQNWLFHTKEVLKKQQCQNLLLIQVIINWTLCHSIQGESIVLICVTLCISLVTPWIVLHLVQLPLLILLVKNCQHQDKQQYWTAHYSLLDIFIWSIVFP